jgi:hypothetical protein
MEPTRCNDISWHRAFPQALPVVAYASRAGKKLPQPHRQSAGRVQRRAALLPEVEIVTQRHAAPLRPAVQRPDIRDRSRIALQQVEHGRDGPAGSTETAMPAEARFVCPEPGTESFRSSFVPRGCPIAGEDGFPIASNGAGIGGVVREWGSALPIIRQKQEAAKRKRFSQSLLDPLAGAARLGIQLPAIAEYVPQFVPELISQIAPIPRADDDNDPARHRLLAVEPDGGVAAGMIIDAEFCRLTLGEQRHARQAGFAHALDHGRRIRSQRLAPAPSKFQRRGEQRHARTDGKCPDHFQRHPYASLRPQGVRDE